MNFMIQMAASACDEVLELAEDVAQAVLRDLQMLRLLPYGAPSVPLRPEPQFAVLKSRCLPTSGFQVVYTVDDHRRVVLVAHIARQL